MDPIFFSSLITTFKNNRSYSFFFQCRLIVAQMSDTRADAWNHLLWLILIVTSLAVAPLDRYNLLILEPHVEQVLVYFLTSVATLTQIHYGVGVVSI